MQITFTAATAAELRLQVLDFALVLGISGMDLHRHGLNLRVPGPSTQEINPREKETTAPKVDHTDGGLTSPPSVRPPADVDPGTPEDPGPTPIKRRRRKKTTTTTPKTAPTLVEEQPENVEPEQQNLFEESETGESNPPQKTYTFDDAKTALKKVSAAHGIPVAADLLGKFNAKKISAVKEEQYPEFIDACEKAAG
jgi:hypothetical protein